MILNTRECNVPFTWYSDHLKKQEVVAVEDGVSIEDMDIFHKHLMLYERRQGLPSVQVLDLPLSNFHKTVCLLTSLET
jgi:protease II